MLTMPRLRLCQAMNRLTGRHRCLPGASGEELWCPIYSSTCSSQRAGNIWTVVQFAQGTLLQSQSGVRCGKQNRDSSEPSLRNTRDPFALHRDTANLGYHHKTQKWTLILTMILQAVSPCDMSVGTMCREFIGSCPNMNK